MDDNLLDKLNAKFMPRESLDIRFKHIDDFMRLIVERLERLPKEMIREIDEKFGKRVHDSEEKIKSLDKKIHDLEGSYKYFLGAASVLGSVAGIVVQFLMKHLG